MIKHEQTIISKKKKGKKNSLKNNLDSYFYVHFLLIFFSFF